MNITLNGKREALEIVLVAHVLTPRGHKNSVQINCSATEHFTISEFEEIYQGIVLAGFFVRSVFFTEIEFICDCTNNPKAYENTIVFNLCRNGSLANKKTVVPSICDLLGIQYTSSGASQCALARNKCLFSKLLKQEGIRCPVTSLNLEEIQAQLSNNELIISKPNTESASQGVHENNIVPVSEATSDGNTLLQQYIDGYECEVPIIQLNDEFIVFPPVGISYNGAYFGILSYETSLNNDYEFYSLLDVLSEDTCKKIMEDAVKTFSLLGLSKYGRVDFRVDKNTHKHYVMDISTTPYITKHSSYSFAFEKMGLKYNDIFSLVVAAALN